MRRRTLWLVVATLGGCGGSRSIPPSNGSVASPAAALGTAAAAPAPDGDRPAWASVGDGESARGFRFICRGEGATPDEATTTARAFCEDKICKLCGVEVESVVQSRETLTGVEMSREIVERCRRVRRAPAEVVRQSLDCPETGSCAAWIEIAYPKAQRDRECRQLADERFEDPAQCQRLLDDFGRIRGYTAASFRARIDRLQRALIACRNIDVRPTPLLNALDERLRRGMATFTDEKGRAPRYLSQHWLQTHAPTWSAYETATTFVQKIELLLGYLRSKPPVLDIIETSLLPPEQLDTRQGFERLLALLAETPEDHGYGVSGVHFFALDRIRSLHRDRMFDQPLRPLWDVLVARYPGEDLTVWTRVVHLIWLAAVDGQIGDDEWRYFMKAPRWWSRAAQMLLAVDDHGAGEVRRERFRGALARALEEARGTTRSVAWATQRVWPRSAFVLELESIVPEAARPALFAFDALRDTFRRIEDDLPAEARARFLARMVEAISSLPQERRGARRRCGRLNEDLAFLEARGVDVSPADAVVCPCLVEHLAAERMSLVGKSRLYRRALDLGLPCVGSGARRRAGS